MTTTSDKIASDAVDCCANCGKAEVDDVKLKDCDGGCDIARYCGDECQKNHLEIHEVICKERAAVLRDEILFRQPESSHLGDCPICFLPMPLDLSKSWVKSCCGKTVCKGCEYTKDMREEQKHRCIFCRKEAKNSVAEETRNYLNRAATNDPVALRQLGYRHRNEGDHDIAFEYLTRAAELGDAGGHYYLAEMYRDGHGVLVEKDEKKEIYHMEEAAIAGHPDARYRLAHYEGRNGRYDRAVKHMIIVANLGHHEAIQALKHCYKNGYASKDEYAVALRAHQAAADAMKSPQRDAVPDEWVKYTI